MIRRGSSRKGRISRGSSGNNSQEEEQQQQEQHERFNIGGVWAYYNPDPEYEPLLRFGSITVVRFTQQ
jgi:hypothetical protein